MRDHDDALISIGAGESQLPLIRSAKSSGLTVVTVDRASDAAGHEIGDFPIVLSTHDTSGVLNALNGLNDAVSFRGVVARTTAQQALLTATAVAHEFGLPGLTPELVRITTEKSSLREFCSAHGLTAPAGICVSSLCYQTDPPQPPVVVKPDMTDVGKQGIYLCRTHAQAEKHVLDAISASPNAKAEIQSFIDGIDVGCAFWDHLGVAKIILFCDELVGFDVEGRAIGLGASLPSVIEGSPEAQVIVEILDTLTSHFPTVDALLIGSFRVTANGDVYLIELHADLGGDKLADVLFPEAVPTFDYFATAIQIATGTLRNTPRIEALPTALYTPFKRPRESAFPGLNIRTDDCAIAKQDSVKSNLQLLSQVNNSCCRLLAEYPRHLDWFQSRHRETALPRRRHACTGN